MTDVLRTTFVSLRSLLRGFGPSSRRGSARGHDRVSVAHVRGIRRARSSACLRAIRGHIIMDSLRGRRFKHHALPGLSTLHPTQRDGRGMHHSVPRRRGLSVDHSISITGFRTIFHRHELVVFRGTCCSDYSLVTTGARRYGRGDDLICELAAVAEDQRVLPGNAVPISMSVYDAEWEGARGFECGAAPV